MMRFVTALVACIALASCTTTGEGSVKINAAIQQSLPQVCAAVDQGYTTFMAVAATGAVKEKTVAKVQNAYAIAYPICINPSQATAASITTKVLVAAFVLKAALKEIGK